MDPQGNTRRSVPESKREVKRVRNQVAVRDKVRQDTSRNEKYVIRTPKSATEQTTVETEELQQTETTLSTRESVKQSVQTVKGKKQRFLTIRMWTNYLLSTLQKDRGKIPDNIGNRMLITNNMYVTRYYMSSVIHVTSLSLDTPVAWTGKLVKFLRAHNCDAVVDFTFKNQDFDVNLNESGMRNRISTWEKQLESPTASRKEREAAARCLYTRDIVQSGQKLMKTRIFITVRAKVGSQLSLAEGLVFKYLNSINANFVLVTGDLKEKLKYMFILADKHFKEVKDMKAIVNSNQTLAQMLPNSGAFNGSTGEYMGNDVMNGMQFMIDWSKITIGRNIYLVAPAGVGKTVFAANLCCSAVENGYAVCITDIKGNEFNNFINGTGGYIVSLRQNSSGYINSWKMNAHDTTDDSAVEYFRQRLELSKKQITILTGIVDAEELTALEELLDAFHVSLYLSLGVLDSNRNTWDATQNLNPFVIYERLLRYLTAEMQRKYGNVARKLINNLRMYMTEDGSRSHLFKQEFDYLSILKAPTLMFDFGMLDGAVEQKDSAIFKLKFLYMRKLNADYIAYKYRQGIKTFKVLEESQIAVQEPEIMRGYVEEFTLRRAQGQTTLLLGNSVSALVDNPLSKSLIENTRALLIGELAPKALDTVVEAFGLEDYRDYLQIHGSIPEYKNSFVFVNNMESKALMPILKLHLEKGKKYKLFTPVAQNTNSVI